MSEDVVGHLRKLLQVEELNAIAKVKAEELCGCHFGVALSPILVTHRTELEFTKKSEWDQQNCADFSNFYVRPDEQSQNEYSSIFIHTNRTRISDLST
jgi:hypothetical protein